MIKKLFTGITLLFSVTAFAQNVGIGTTTPTKPLTIKTDGIGVSQESSGTAKIGFYTAGTNAYLQTHSPSDLKFATNDSSFTMILQRGTGNLGIGQANPTAKLDVNGQIKITGGTPGAGKYLISDASGLASWYDASTSLLPAGATGNTLRHNGTSWVANSLLYNNGTSIGIGTTSPNSNYPLDINGRARLRYNGATAGMWYNKADNTEAVFAGMYNDSTFGFFGTNGWSSGFDVKNGLLGIGNMDPTAPLSFPSITGNKISLWGDANGGHYGIGIQGSLLQIYSSASNADIAFGYGRSTSFAETMRITGTGKVGIGGITPTGYQLHVLGWPNSKLLQLENTDILDAGINNTIMFQTGGKYTGAIKTIGINNNEASLGFYTGTSATETGLLRRMTIANSGNIGIGTFAPIAKLHIEDLTNTTSKTPFFILTQSGGQTQHYIELGTTTNVTNKAGLFSSFGNSNSYGVDASGDGTAFTAGVYASSQTVSGYTGTRYAGYFQGNLAYTGTLINASDASLKTNILPFENALTSLKKIEIKQYQFTEESKKILNTGSGLHYGVLAQQLQEVFPTLVSTQLQPIREKSKNKDGVEKQEQTGFKEYLGVNYMELIPVLIKGMQEQQVMIEELKKKIDVLEKK